MALIHLRNFKLQNSTLWVEQGQLPLMGVGHGHLPGMQVRKVSELIHTALFSCHFSGSSNLKYKCYSEHFATLFMLQSKSAGNVCSFYVVKFENPSCSSSTIEQCFLAHE